jgi:hypothetical protein
LGGAVPEDDYWRTVREAGFAEAQIVSRHLLMPEELQAMACCPGEEFTPPPSSLFMLLTIYDFVLNPQLAVFQPVIRCYINNLSPCG